MAEYIAGCTREEWDRLTAEYVAARDAATRPDGTRPGWEHADCDHSAGYCGA